MNTKDVKEWLTLPETKAAIQAIKDEVRTGEVYLRKVGKDHHESEAGFLNGLDRAVAIIEELGEEE